MGDVIDVVRRVEEAYSSGRLELLDELISPDLKAETPGSDQIHGIEGIKGATQMSKSAFPDKNVAIEDIFAEGDMVALRCRMTGTNRGGLPWFGIPANDKEIDIQWIAMYRVQEGKIVESWAQMDLPKMMQQLGAMPGPGGM
ncbi:MAG: ester cyclase [Actinomycetota bacterium]